MAKRKLNNSTIDAMSAGNRDLFVWDEGLPGFGVRIKTTGVKSYIVQYRNRTTGDTRRKTLGKHGPLLTYTEARRRARVILGQAIDGKDPVADSREARRALTMKQLADDYIANHATPRKRPRSLVNDRNMLASVILPALGRRRIKDVSPSEIRTLHNRMVGTPYHANRMLALLSSMFSYANRAGLRPDNPVKGIERFHEERRERWLTNEELSRLIDVLVSHPNQKAANAVRLQILTGARIGEVLKAEWSHFDLDRGIWTKPSHHTKQRRTEHLPLSSQAIDLLSTMRDNAQPESIHLFPGKAKGKPISEIRKFWRGVCETADLQGYRLHDNRHTYASHLVSEGLSLEIVGRLLGHTNPMTTRRYAHLADTPLRAAAEQFAARLPSS